MEDLTEGFYLPTPPGAKVVFEGRIFSVLRWEQEMYDGSKAIFERIKKPDTAFAVGVLPDEKVLLVRDEQPHRGPMISPAGGCIEKGEKPENGARREFREETGYEIGELIPWFKYAPNVKVEAMQYCYIGRQLVKTGEPRPDAGEKIEVEIYSFDDFLQLGRHKDLRNPVIKNILLEALLDLDVRDKLYNLFYG